MQRKNKSSKGNKFFSLFSLLSVLFCAYFIFGVKEVLAVAPPKGAINIYHNSSNVQYQDYWNASYGSSVALTWSTTDTTSCSMSPGGWTDLNKSAPGQSTGSLTSSQTYTLTCSGPGGNNVVVDSIRIIVRGYRADPSDKSGEVLVFDSSRTLLTGLARLIEGNGGEGGSPLDIHPSRANLSWNRPAPDNFSQGDLYVRVKVMCLNPDMPTPETFGMFFNFWQYPSGYPTSGPGEKHAEKYIPNNFSGLSFTYNGSPIERITSYHIPDMEDAHGDDPVAWPALYDWSIPRFLTGVFSFGENSDGSESGHARKLNLLAAPMNYHVTAVAVSPGHTFSGWDYWLGTNRNTQDQLNADCKYPAVPIVTGLSANSTISGTVNVGVSLPDTDIYKIELRANNPIAGIDVASPYAFAWDTRNVANGTYNILVKAYDKNGLTNSATVSNVTVNNTSAGGQNLTVIKTGTGTGTVTSVSPATPVINCGTGSGCTGNYADNTAVVLHASPDSGSTFAGWSGACTNLTGDCSLNMGTTDKNVEAVFNNSSGGFSVVIVASPSGPLTAPGTTDISWATSLPADSCEATGTDWSGVNLISPIGRSGMPVGTYNFGIKCNKAGFPDATDTVAVVVNSGGGGGQFPLTVTKSGTGSGNVISIPSGVSCHFP